MTATRRAVPRVVFLSAHLPSANSTQAGQRVAYDHLQLLAQTFPVDLIAFANAAERLDMDGSVNALCQRVEIIPVTTWTRIRGAISRPDLPTYIALRASGRITRMVAQLCEQSSNVVLWAEYTQMAQYIRSLNGSVRRTVLVCQDVLGQLCERYARLKSWPVAQLTRVECSRLARWEAKVVKQASVAVTMSEKDRILLRQLGAYNVVVAYPRAQFAPTRQPECAIGTEPTMMFFGAMDRSENHEAVVWFLEMVLPAIRSVIPNVRVLIVGAHPARALLALCQQTQGVDVTGYVPDPRPWFAETWFGIVPLQSGAGLKVKVVEFLAQGLPVVTTTIGSEGITAQGEDGLIVSDTAVEFARHCIVLLGDRDKCRFLGQAAHRWFTTSYRPQEFGSDGVRKLVLGYP